MNNESKSFKKRKQIISSRGKFKKVSAFFVFMFVQVLMFMPIIKVDAEVEENYKVLLWVLGYTQAPTSLKMQVDILENHFNNIDGVTIVEKFNQNSVLTKEELEDVKLIYLIDYEWPVNYVYSQRVLESSEVVKDYLKSGGRIVLGGEKPDGPYTAASAGNALLTAFGTSLGGHFEITETQSDELESILNTTAKPDLLEGLNDDDIKPAAFAHIKSTSESAVWVAKDKNDNVFILDEQVENGFITVISDGDWLRYNIPNNNYYDYTIKRNAANRKFLYNLLFTSVKNMEKFNVTYKVNENLTYNGEEQVGVTYNNVTAISGTDKATNAGTYTVTLAPTEGKTWSDGTTEPREVSWSIKPANITDDMIKFEDEEVTYDGEEHSINITGELLGGTIEYSTDGINYSSILPTFKEVGEYTIYYRARKTNYNDITGSKTLTINKKTITDYTVIIENQIYTGEDIKPTVILKDGDKIIPSSEYEVEYEDNIGPGTGKVIIKNKDGGNYTIETKNTTFTIIDPEKVEITDPSTPNPYKTKLENYKDEVISKIDFTEEDLNKMNQGKKISVYLEVKDISDTISDIEKNKLEEKLDNNKSGLYLDINLFKKVEEEEPIKITELKNPITVSFEIPDKLINKDSNIERIYKMLRLHNGNVEELDVKVNGKIAIFETDSFSTYALTYKDTNASSNSNAGNGNNNASSNSNVENGNNNASSNPKTGDNIGTSFIILIISSLGLISTLGYAVISKKKKISKD